MADAMVMGAATGAALGVAALSDAVGSRDVVGVVDLVGGVEAALGDMPSLDAAVVDMAVAANTRLILFLSRAPSGDSSEGALDER
jgi:hypothetical protein